MPDGLAWAAVLRVAASGAMFGLGAVYDVEVELRRARQGRLTSDSMLLFLCVVEAGCCAASIFAYGSAWSPCIVMGSVRQEQPCRTLGR